MTDRSHYRRGIDVAIPLPARTYCVDPTARMVLPSQRPVLLSFQASAWVSVFVSLSLLFHSTPSQGKLWPEKDGTLELDVRREILKLHNGRDVIVTDSDAAHSYAESRSSFVQLMSTSRFCLVPRGRK